MQKYKIIFLDIDGVMNSDQYNRYKYKHHRKVMKEDFEIESYV